MKPQGVIGLLFIIVPTLFLAVGFVSITPVSVWFLVGAILYIGGLAVVGIEMEILDRKENEEDWDEKIKEHEEMEKRQKIKKTRKKTKKTKRIRG